MKTIRYHQACLAITVAFLNAMATHAALTERQPATSRMVVVELAQHILENRLNEPIIITDKHKRELEAIVEKSPARLRQIAQRNAMLQRLTLQQRISFQYKVQRNERGEPYFFHKDIQLYGIINRLPRDIETNIIEFLGVPVLNFTACPDEHDKDSDWYKSPALLVAVKPIEIGWGGVYIYDRSTGKKLHSEEGESLQALGGIAPGITIDSTERGASTKDIPRYDSTVTVQDVYGLSHPLPFSDRASGNLCPMFLQSGKIAFHDPVKQVRQSLTQLSLMQAVALRTIRKLSEDTHQGQTPLLTTEPLLRGLTDQQTEAIVFDCGHNITTPPTLLSTNKRKRSQQDLAAKKLFQSPALLPR